MGALTGVLSQRVLGQYDLALLDAEVPPRLLLLAPNLAQAARNLGVDRDELVLWVTIHEITHAVQFGGAPWLREHLGGHAAGADRRPAGEARPRSTRDGCPRRGRGGGGGWIPKLDGLGINPNQLRELVERARRGELLRLTLGEERWQLVERMQATMSLIEGHAEHTMDAVGAEVLPSLPRLRAALNRRRETRGLPWRVLERLLGLELKMRQYEVGKRFCDAVVAGRGPAGAGPRVERAGAAAEHRRAGDTASLAGPNARSSCYKLGDLIRPVHRSLRFVKVRCNYLLRAGYKQCVRCYAETRGRDRTEANKRHPGPRHEDRTDHRRPLHMPTATPLPPAAPKPRKPAAKAAKASTARKARAPRKATQAKSTKAKAARTRSIHQTQSAVRQTEIAARNTVDVFGDYAERAVLIPVGAALIARDRVVSTVSDTISSYGSTRQGPGPAAPLRAPRHHRPQPARARGPQSPRARRARTAPAPPRPGADASTRSRSAATRSRRT